MSRGFVKEEDQEEPVIIPPRAAIPDGVTNYVTPNGLQELHLELKGLEKERSSISIKDDTEKRRAQGLIDGKMKLLAERIQSARVLKPEEQAQNEIRFGAHIKLKNLDSSQIQKFQIVGVDEANIKMQKIAFVAPIARAVTGKKVGETVDFKLGDEIRKLKVFEISY